MPVRSPHDVKDALDVLERNVLVKKVTHRVHEYRLRLLPRERKLQHPRLQRQVKPVLVIDLTHGLESFSHAFSVAVLASRADLVAAGYRVPRRFGPLNS